jgi:hypothetical protein
LYRRNDKIGLGEGERGVATRLAAHSDALGRDRHFTDGINGSGGARPYIPLDHGMIRIRLA